MAQTAPNPYQSWLVDPAEFPREDSLMEQIKFLLNFAILAPSSHNTQPWQFRVGEDFCELYADRERALAHSDPRGRQLFISLGAALANLLVSARHYGLGAQVVYFPEGGGGDLTARIEFFRGGSGESVVEESGSLKELFPAISQRHSNRNFYEDRPLDDGFLVGCRSYLAAGEAAGEAGEELRCDFVEEREKKEKIAQITMKAGQDAHDDPAFRKELFSWIRSNYTRSFDGMPGFGMGIPGPISIIAPWMILFLKVGKIQSKKDGEMLQDSPVIVVVSAKDDQPLTWLKAGGLAQKIMLKAAVADIQSAIMAAPIEIGEHWRKLQEVLETDFRPEVLLRLGYCAKKMRHSPRRPLEMVLRG